MSGWHLWDSTGETDMSGGSMQKFLFSQNLSSLLPPDQLPDLSIKAEN